MSDADESNETEADENQTVGDWFEDAWDEFNDEAPDTAGDSRAEDRALNGPPSRGGDTSDAGNVGVYDVLSRSQYPAGKRRTHPIHGSDTGSNFAVDDNETWVCWRGTCNPTGDGDATVGNALHLIGMEHGVIGCGDWSGGGLSADKWREIFDIARDEGYDVPERKVAQSKPLPEPQSQSNADDFDSPQSYSVGENRIDPSRLLDAVDVNDWSPSEVMGTRQVVRGQVSKRSEPKIRYETAGYECLNCHHINRAPQNGDDIEAPNECEGCGEEAFTRMESADIVADYQRIRVQELPERSGTTTGDTIDVDLLGDLVDDVTPGDRIVIDAALEPEESGNKRVKELYGTAKGIHPLDPDIEDIDIEPHREAIQAIAAGDHTADAHPTGNEDDTPYGLLERSVLPEHEGNEAMTKGVVYQLFSGGMTANETLGDDGGTNTLHMLLIGDPSTGKSEVLTRIREIMPRGIYTSGKGASAAGLTASAVRDQFGDSGWTLEAGALVRANGGIAAVDELDKMEKSDRNGLLECMSEQQVSIAKAGMTSTFPAQTTVIAAANPEEGHFTDFQNMQEEVDLSSPVISRFDLSWVFRDEADEATDSQIAERMNAAEIQRTGGSEQDIIAQPLDDDVIRAYIQRAHSVTPTLTAEAAEEIRETYVEIRGDEQYEKLLGVVAPRTVSTLHALAEASARIRLSDTITEDDVNRALQIYNGMKANNSGTDIGYSGDGASSFSAGGDSAKTRQQSLKGVSQQERRNAVVQTVRRMNDEHDEDEGCPSTAEIINELMDRGIEHGTAQNDLEQLQQGRGSPLYTPPNGGVDVV